MDPERFRNSTAGRVKRMGQGEEAYWAFIPNPLPPKISPDWELICHISEADRALSELAGLGRTMPNPHLLIGPFVRREAILSSQIEGTRADIVDLYAYEAGQLPPPGLETSSEDVREVQNYVKALEYALERRKTLPVSLRLIREIHEKLLTDVRGKHATPGEFRQSQNWIGPPNCTLNQATFVPPPVPHMHEALDALEKYLHQDDTYPPLMRLALIHYQFEAIHPFVDGNGRIGRLLLTLLLIQWGLLPSPLLYLSAYLHRHREEYYQLLLNVSERGAWRDWLIFFMRGIAQQSRDATMRARRLQDLRESWRQQLGTMKASTRTLQLIDELFSSPIITIPRAADVLGVTYHSAQNTVEKLVEAGILEPIRNVSYSKTFIAREIMIAIGSELE